MKEMFFFFFLTDRMTSLEEAVSSYGCDEGGNEGGWNTLQFYSIGCPIKKCKGSVSFQRAGIHFFKISQTIIMLN